MRCGRCQPVKHDTIGLHWDGVGGGVLGKHMGSKRAHTHTLIWHTTFSYSRIPQASCTKIFAQLAIENWKTFSYICFGFIQLTVAARAPSYTHTHAFTGTRAPHTGTVRDCWHTSRYTYLLRLLLLAKFCMLCFSSKFPQLSSAQSEAKQKL